MVSRSSRGLTEFELGAMYELTWDDRLTYLERITLLQIVSRKVRE